MYTLKEQPRFLMYSMENYNKKIEKTIVKNKKNYDEAFIEVLLTSYALYYMSTDGFVKKPNIKNIAARACISTTKLNKIFKKFNGHLFKISYYTKGQRKFVDSIELQEDLYKLIHVKKNQFRIHQDYVTKMIKTKMPSSSLATIVFYITVSHANAAGASSITIKKISGILSQKYEQRETIEDQISLINIKKKLFKLHEEKIDQNLSIKEFNSRRNKLIEQEAEIASKAKVFRVVQSYEFNNKLEENIRHSYRVLLKHGVLNKYKKIYFLNLENNENNKNNKNINIDNVEPGTTNNLFINKKEKRLLEGHFFLTKNQIKNTKNFKNFCNAFCRSKILLAKSYKFFKKQCYKKSSRYFQKNLWLLKKTYFAQKLKEKIKDFLRENIKMRKHFYVLSKLFSSLIFNQNIDLAISLFENIRDFIVGKNLYEVNWNKFYFFKKLTF